MKPAERAGPTRAKRARAKPAEPEPPGQPVDGVNGDPRAALIEFAAAASHDLSTPLQLISGYADILGERLHGGDDEAEVALHGIQRAVERMRSLVDGLLGYARLGDEMAAEAVDVGKVIGDTLHAFAPEIKTTGAAVEVADGLPVVFAIPGQLHQLFQNLISNALKFSSEAPPVIAIDCTEEPGVWHFTVADNGIGIEQHDMIHVFDIFKRSRSVRDRPGSGIGLAVARGVVERHGGRIWAESATGKGSTLHFTLPVELRRASDPAVAGPR